MSSTPSTSPSDAAEPLSRLPVGIQAVIVGVRADPPARAARLAALGVTPGAVVVLLQTFPAFVFRCDQTELAVESEVARMILVERQPDAAPLGSPRTELRAACDA